MKLKHEISLLKLQRDIVDKQLLSSENSIRQMAKQQELLYQQKLKNEQKLQKEFERQQWIKQKKDVKKMQVTS